MPISFGPFAFDRQNRLLWREGAEIALPPRVLGVLELLLERAGEVVSRQELMERVWKDAFVTDTSLAEAVSFLRQSLGDDPQAPRFIQTVHRRGYRFVAAVTNPDAPGPVAAAPEAVEHAPLRPSIGRDLAPWSIAAIALVLAIAAVWHIAREPDPAALPTVRFELRPAAGSWFDRRAPALAVSPDAATFAWSACDGTTNVCGLFVRRLDRLEAMRLGGTDGAEAPFFSPDGRWLGFFADGKLKKIAVSGGSAITLADAPDPGGAAWGPDGRIVFSGLPAGGLQVASDQGGEVNPLTTPAYDRGELRHEWPSFLPGGGSLIFTVVTSPVPGASGQLAVMPLPSRSWRTVRSGVVRAVPSGPGYLLLSSGADLQAVTFEERTLTLTGPADTVLEGLDTAAGSAQFAVSGGTLVAVHASPAPKTVAWSDALDRPLAGVGRLTSIALAPDGRRAAGVVAEANASDIWIADLERGGLTRLTYGGVNVSPAWSRDGRAVYFATRQNGTFHVAAAAIGDRGAAPTPVPDASALFPSSITSGGKVVGVTFTRSGHLSIVGAAGSPAGPVDERAPALSPDERWLAYESDETGTRQVYVRNLADRRRFQVSAGPGERPSWDANGRAIFFVDGERVVRAAFDPGSPSPVAERSVVFDRPDAAPLATSPAGRVLVERQPVTLDAATVVLQWVRELRQTLPAPVAAPR